MTKRHTTMKEKIEIHRLLEQNLEKISDDLWKYKGNLDDAKIASLVAKDLNRYHVQTIRQEIFGKINVSRVSDEEIFERMDKQDQEIVSLRERLGKLEKLHAAVTNTLALNKVANVKHLSGEPIQTSLPLKNGEKSSNA